MTLGRTHVAGFFAALLLGGCSGRSGDVSSESEGALRRTSSTTEHDVFVCQSEDTSIDRGVTMFAYDQQSEGNSRAKGFCSMIVTSEGRVFGSYWCDFGDTRTETTTDDQLALLFVDDFGDGRYRYRQLNLPKDLVEKREGVGRLRISNTEPSRLSTPIGDTEQRIECKEKKVEFRAPPQRIIR